MCKNKDMHIQSIRAYGDEFRLREERWLEMLPVEKLNGGRRGGEALEELKELRGERRARGR